MSFSRYPTYKDSGVEWLGQVPEHWAASRLKHFAKIVNDRLDNKPRDAVYLGLENIESQTGRLLVEMTADEVESVVGTFQAGDVLFGKLRPYLAKVALPSFSGVCTTELLAIRTYGNGGDSKFLQYLLLSEPVINLVDSYTYGSKMPRVNAEQIANTVFPLPSYEEQRAIAAFLDTETARIDALVSKQEALLALLQEKRRALISHAVTKGLDAGAPMKDSGVAWLGEVPAHWELKRLKFISEVRTGVAKGRDLGSQEVVEIPYLRVANVQDGYLDLSDVASLPLPITEIDRYLLKPGDLLMNEGGDFDKLGRGYVWQGEIEPCSHQNHVFAVRLHNPVDAYWVNLATQSSYAKQYFISRSKQSTNLASISSSNIQEWPVVMPPEAERRATRAHVETETAGVDTLIVKARQCIDLLRERRAALIAAAVTGQIDVRGYAAMVERQA